MNRGHWIDLELSVSGVTERMKVRVGNFGERSMASVELGRITSNGIGATAREAQVAALSPRGNRMTTAVLAAPARFGVSAELLAAGE
jgi:hypothetical protein